MSDRDVMLKLLREGSGITSSWDWEMDHIFAKEIGEDHYAELMIEVMNTEYTPLPQRIKCWELYIRPKITKRRLRALRILVKEGIVTSHWAGTGVGGLADLGLSRVKDYMLVEAKR